MILTPIEITIEQKDWSTWMIAFLVWDYQIDQRIYIVIDIMDDLGFSFAIEGGYDENNRQRLRRKMVTKHFTKNTGQRNVSFMESRCRKLCFLTSLQWTSKGFFPFFWNDIRENYPNKSYLRKGAFTIKKLLLGIWSPNTP